MPLTPLAPRSGNICQGPELTPYARGEIIGAAEACASPYEIA